MLYGSIHTHFESQYDTGNDKKTMVKNFIKAGAKKVAVTEHGVFSSYEDLKDIVSDLKKEFKEKGEALDFDIIPGVEGYFGEDANHIILIAKDYEGYVSLCKIISESNKNVVKGKPIITLENLKENVAKGHLVCTTACIAGPFGSLFGLKEINAKEKLEELNKELTSSNYWTYSRIIKEYEEKKAEAKANKVTQKAKTAAEKIKKNTGNLAPLELLEEQEAKFAELTTWLNEHESEYNDAIEVVKNLGKAKFAKKESNYIKYTNLLEELTEKKNQGMIEIEAYNLLDNFLTIFGSKNFYFELQNHGLDKEAEIYSNIVKFAYSAGHSRFIASNDIHVGLEKSDENYEKELLRRNVMKFTRFNKYDEETVDDREYVIKSNEELVNLISEIIPDGNDGISITPAQEIAQSAVNNIEHILEECSIEFPQNESHYPKFCEDENAEFERKVREGIALKFPNGYPKGKEKDYEERLEYELGVIKEMGYSGYHLIVADYLEYGRLLGYLPTQEEIDNAPTTIKELDAYITDRGYPRIGYAIGPGRGSAVGSLCCYALGITDIDPIPYDLLFERFLNVERVSMPDIDSDFKVDIRAKCVEYCKVKYGAECICQIMTKAYGAAKGNIRLAARYLGTKRYEELYGKLSTDNVKEQDTSKLTEEELLDKIEEENPGVKDYLKEWYNRADRLSKKFDELSEEKRNLDGLISDESQQEDLNIIELAKNLDGVFTNYGEHAAGTIISGDDLREIIPLRWNEKKGSMETQCTMAQAEAKGLLKMDFLGLKNLDIITDVLKNPTKTKELADFLGIDINAPISEFLDGKLQNYAERDEILKDPAIYRDIFCTGLTQGVFQFSSAGMKKMLIDFQPENFGDLILLVSAYRPGPMDYIPEIVAEKWFNKYKNDFAKYEETIKRIYPFNEEEYKKKKENKIAYFYDEHGNVLHYVPHSITLQNEALQKILAPTYGCPIYQEQIMRIFQDMAGYSLGGADIVRRYMSKKKRDKLAHEKETFVYGDEERGIPGAVKLHGITVEEAEELFEQMMPFAEYGFNKSHATAYAMVAMYTAYLKKYHTADFFRSCLNWTGKLSEIPEYVAELPAFGLSFNKPSMMESRNPFSVEPDGSGIRYGLQYVKGFSEQNISRSSCIQNFMRKNPNVSIKMLEKYAQLGMFEECWNKDLKTRRVKGNRHECLRWIAKNAPIIQKYQAAEEKIETLGEELSILEAQLSCIQEDSEEKSLLVKDYNKTSRLYTNWIEKKEAIAKELNDNIDRDTLTPVKKETAEEILENRKWEIEFLSLPFDIEDSLQIVNASGNKRTFADLAQSFEENHGKIVKIPAVVLSVSDLKTTKGGKSYYDVMLMDRNRNIITRRFSGKVNELEGEFPLYLDECRYYVINLEKDKIKPIVYKKNNIPNILPQNAPQKDKLNAIANGAQWNSYMTVGRTSVNVIQLEDAPEYTDIER